MLRATAFPQQDCGDHDQPAADLEGDEDELFSLSFLVESVRWFRFHFWRSIEHFPEQCCMRAEYLNGGEVKCAEMEPGRKCAEKSVTGEKIWKEKSNRGENVLRWNRGENVELEKRSGWQAGTICHEQLHGQLILFRARPLCLVGRTPLTAKSGNFPRP